MQLLGRLLVQAADGMPPPPPAELQMGPPREEIGGTKPQLLAGYAARQGPVHDILDFVAQTGIVDHREL